MGAAPDRLHVRLAADPASVMGARRFIGDGLSAWEAEHLRDAAELVASELTTNVALHAGAEFMYVSLERAAWGVRLSVEDDGPLGVDVVQVRSDIVNDTANWDELEATGRGLAIVGLLAQRWGVDQTPRGKQVWAEIHDAQDGSPAGHRAEPELPPTPAQTPEQLPPGWVMVRLAGCPVALSLQQDRHLDELVRELQLLSVDRGDPRHAALAEEIRGILIAPTHARLTGRKAAQRALADGKDLVDVDMAMPREFGALVLRLHDAVARADQLCREGHLLTLASPPAVQRLRAWMTHEVVEQATHSATPTTWAEWLTESSDYAVCCPEQ